MGSSLGCTPHLGLTYAAEVHPLRPYLTGKKEFPLSPRSRNAQARVRKLCEKTIKLAVPDWQAAMDGTRPFVQLADGCGFAIGGAHTQLDEQKRTGVLAVHTRGLSATQQLWPAWEVEL